MPLADLKIQNNVSEAVTSWPLNNLHNNTPGPSRCAKKFSTGIMFHGKGFKFMSWDAFQYVCILWWAMAWTPSCFSMTFGDFIVSKQVGFQAFFVKRLWDSSDLSYSWTETRHPAPTVAPACWGQHGWYKPATLSWLWKWNIHIEQCWIRWCMQPYTMYKAFIEI